MQQRIMFLFFASWLIGCSVRAGADSVSLPEVQGALADGDLIFQESESRQSAAIRAATGSRYSHVGMVFGVAEGTPYVLEAVSPVKKTGLAAFIRRGKDAHFVVTRLSEPLSRAAARKLRKEAERYLGKPYDLTFDWSDQRIYCSELVWKAYERALGLHVGEPQPFSALSLDGSEVRALAEKRLGRLPPPDAPVITPVRVMDSPLLTRVIEGELE